MYKLIPGSEAILRLSDMANIPASESNRDYAAYLEWCAEGNLPDPVDPLQNPPPSSVTMRQARLALLAVGKLDAAQALVDSLGGAAKIEWEYAHVVERGNPLVHALGLSDTEMDGLFLLASTK